MVTAVGPAGPSGAGADQAHVPAALSWVTVPLDAVIATVPLPCALENVPVLHAVWPSSTTTLALSAATAGPELAPTVTA